MAVDAQRARELRDSAERIILRATRRAMRAYLDQIREATLAGIARLPETGLTAALTDPIPEPVERFAPGEVPLLGNSAGRWAALVDEHITDAVADAFTRVYEEFATKGLALTSPALSGMEAFTNQVRDRLVRGTHFGVTVYEDSFDQVRTALAQSVTEGWTRSELSQRIAASLSWETDGSYWRGVKAGVDSKIDAILDALGPPGHPAREFARLNDPLVQQLRNERNIAIRHLDAERSIWQTRAMLIARTESTSVANYGALTALVSEGWTHKEWVSTLDPRTRESHAQANGQVVRIDEEFRVGDEKLAFPGDPSATVGEVANCRCALIGAAASVTPTTEVATQLPEFPPMLDDYAPQGTMESPDHVYKELSKKRPGGLYGFKQPPALDDYLGWGYRDINGYLRSGEGGRAGTVKALDKAFDTVAIKLPWDITLLRGVYNLDPAKFVPGQQVVEASYTSTTLSPNIAQRFARTVPGNFADWNASGQGDGWFMRILAPKGTRGIVPNGSGEYEVILPRNSKFLVHQVNTETREVWLEVVK